jgi:molecular chaperone HtpG
VSTIVKLGVLEDEKFYDRVKNFLLWQNTSNEWTTVPDYLERHREKNGDKIFYTGDIKHAASFLEIYKNKGIEILCANQPLDPYLIHFLEGKLSPVVFQRIDADVSEHLLDKSREKTLLDAEGKTEAGRLADFIRGKLTDELIEVEAKSLATDEVPGFVTIDEKQRRMRDYMLRMDPKQLESGMAMMGKRTFVVNTNHPLVEVIQKLDVQNPDLAKELTKELYDLALLSQREMSPADLNAFISRTHLILTGLAAQVVKS